MSWHAGLKEGECRVVELVPTRLPAPEEGLRYLRRAGPVVTLNNSLNPLSGVRWESLAAFEHGIRSNVFDLNVCPADLYVDPNGILIYTSYSGDHEDVWRYKVNLVSSTQPDLLEATNPAEALRDPPSSSPETYDMSVLRNLQDNPKFVIGLKDPGFLEYLIVNKLIEPIEFETVLYRRGYAYDVRKNPGHKLTELGVKKMEESNQRWAQYEA